MKEELSVLYDSLPVGKAEVIRQGLYYRISCRYRLSSGELCRLIVKWQGGWENLGIPVPEGDGFLLVKKVPVKKIPEADVSLLLIPVGKDPDEPDPREDTQPASTVALEGPVEEDIGPTKEAGENNETERRQIMEDQPFDDLDRLENARLDTVEGKAFAVFEEDRSELEPETDRTVVGPEDIRVDGGLDDVIPEPV